MRSMMWGSLLLVAGSAIAGLPTLVSSRKINFEKFREFQFEQAPLLGFCPQLGGAYQASIRLQSNGRYQLELSVVEEGDPQIDECAELDFVEIKCGVIRSFSARELSDVESARVRRTFRSIKVHTWSVGDVCVDPCRLVTARWDQTVFDDTIYGCGPGVVELLDEASVNELFQLLDGLAIR